MTDPLDPYFYARHDGRWVVCGPAPDRNIYGEVVLDVPALDKSVAYIIAKLLSGQFRDADRMLHDRVALMPAETGRGEVVELRQGKMLE
jgi:hypothetical protein